MDFHLHGNEYMRNDYKNINKLIDWSVKIDKRILNVVP